MDERWETLRAAATAALNPLWDNFAREGRESAALAPLAHYPNAAAWLARSMGASPNYVVRKLAAMLAGWIQDPSQLLLLQEMLERERNRFREDSLSANSVGEDLMFSATRWTQSQHPQVSRAGADVLARMVEDALGGTPWNTAHWAVANLYRVTGGEHEMLQRLRQVADEKIRDQKFFRNALLALKRQDTAALGRLATSPSVREVLSPSDPHYCVLSALWRAAEAAEAAGQ